MKGELKEQQDEFYENIAKIKEGKVKIKAIAKRIGELNAAIGKDMEAYIKVFDAVYTSLYPANDASKSKEARQARKKQGAAYFTEKESEAVIQLYTMGKFLLQFADSNIKGEYDEK